MELYSSVTIRCFSSWHLDWDRLPFLPGIDAPYEKLEIEVTIIHVLEIHKRNKGNCMLPLTDNSRVGLLKEKLKVKKHRRKF